MPMPLPNDIPIETPSSSGESEQTKEPCQRKKRRIIKHGSINPVSQIPRASSVHRIETSAIIIASNDQLPPPSDSDKFKEPSKSLVPYRIRKSLSQMDMKQSRKNHSRFPRTNKFQDSYSSIALPKPVLIQSHTLNAARQDILFPTKNELMYMVNEPEVGGSGAKAAGMKIFATIMLNAWRKRRNDVKRLNDEVDQLQKRSIKVKNQIHVLNSVFRNEQKQNEKLNRQLRHATEEYQRMQSTVESLTTSLISAKAEASLFEQQLHTKEQENDTLNNILTETNSQLFKSMTQIRHLQTSLSCEQRNLQLLENQKNELLNEINLNKMKFRKEEEKHLVEIYRKDEELSKLNSEVKMLETLLMDLKEKEFQVRDMKKNEHKLKNEIDTLKSEVRSLKTDLDKSISARVKLFWNNYMDLHYNTLLLVHLGAFYLLPALPPPKTTKMPVTISLEKVMSIIRE